MGLFTVAYNEEEIKMIRESIVESFSLFGKKVIFYEVESSDPDLYRDRDVVYKDPVDIHVVFESDQRKVLEKMGWWSEDEELPMVANLPYYIKGTPANYQRYSMLEVPEDAYLRETRKYLMSEVVINDANSHYVCKLVPYRPTELPDVGEDHSGKYPNDPPVFKEWD